LQEWCMFHGSRILPQASWLSVEHRGRLVRMCNQRSRSRALVTLPIPSDALKEIGLSGPQGGLLAAQFRN
jgi:hypothetical protein